MRSMKAALTQSIDGSFAKRSAFAERLGVNESEVSRWCDEALPKKTIPGKWIPATLAACSDKTFARYLAGLAGGEFHETPVDVVGPIEKPTMDLIGKTADVLKSVEAVEKNPTPETFVRLETDAEEMIAAVRSVREQGRAAVSASMARPVRMHVAGGGR